MGAHKIIRKKASNFMKLQENKTKMKRHIPSHCPGSEVPHDSHLPTSSGRPRKGFESWLE